VLAVANDDLLQKFFLLPIHIDRLAGSGEGSAPPAAPPLLFPVL
jgi:hypothetical protein